VTSRILSTLELKEEYDQELQERDFFVGTVPDPSQLDEGLLLYIDVSTLKDYHLVKNKMQTVMTKFILHLSKIAVKAAETDPDVEFELWRNKNSGLLASDEVEDVETGERFKVDQKHLKPVKHTRKKAS
jgi:hypothetical protein